MAEPKQSSKKYAWTKPTYEEWNCQITNGENGPQYEKLKKMREGIQITEEQAEILNTGVLRGNNTYALMYFLPETKTEN